MVKQLTGNWQGRTLGPYQFLHPLGRGGMGEVWLVADQRDQRQFAIKLLTSVLASEHHYRSMFMREARIAASLHHPYILPIYDFGEHTMREDEIVCYLVMPYIPGGTLRQRMQQGLLPVAEGLQYLKQAAEAIDYIHSQQVLHRDIKPANLLLQENWLLLSDFGIARLLSSDTYRSHTHAGSGTPEYMAPEQVQSQAEAASDRYSLGVIAYQIFTGSLPFTGKDPYEILAKHINEQPLAPHLLNPDLPSQVEHVLLRALAKQPAERYPSCGALSSALAYAYSSESVATISTPLSLYERDETTFQPEQPLTSPRPSDEPQPLQMAPMHLNKPSGEVTHIASGAEQKTEPASQHKKRPGRRAVLIGGAATVLLLTGTTTAVVLLKDTSTLHSSPPGPRQFTSGKALMILTSHKLLIENVAWDTTGRYLATAGNDTHVMLWDVGGTLQKHLASVQTMSQPTHTWKFTYAIAGNALHWTLDGRKLIISNSDSQAFTLLDPFAAPTRRQIFTNKNIQDIFTTYESVVSRPNSTMLAAIVYTTGGPIQIGLWQLDQPDTPVSQLTYKVSASQSNGNPIRLTVLAWSCDGLLLAGHLTSQQLVIWNAQTRTVQNVITIPAREGKGNVNILKVPLAWSPTDPHIVAAFNIDTIVIIDVRQGKVLYQLTTDEKDAQFTSSDTYPHVISISWSPNGRYLAGCFARSLRVHVWDLQAHTSKTGPHGERLQQYLIPEAGQNAVHTNTIYALSWSPDGRYLATASYDLSTIIWQVDTQ